ncbi:hypothetical protein LDL08_02695 [Nonomuraea glycinis]|uniref:Uncharacterized protein n=1 Tax=Nonomuraea glycinis TaxID=2047744 RepID=A0A918A0C3_9ACTN|nr:hypothetical protein [Nonomuraea glycinis]MCA2175086.1 hypothetical protein [Nonomuraea glycinis]GGP00914.1 hypothetical protein GCM10012278_02730 [Nonomuraea glycinis]
MSGPQQEDPRNARQESEPDARGGGPGSSRGNAQRVPVRDPHEGEPSPEPRTRWGATQQTDGHGHVRHPVPGWGIPPRETGTPPRGQSGEGNHQPPATGAQEHHQPPASGQRDTGTPPQGHTGERHHPVPVTDGHGHVRHPVPGWGVSPRDGGVAPDTSHGRDAGAPPHGRHDGTTGMRPHSQLRSRDDANGDPVSNPYERLEQQQNRDHGAQKTTTEQPRTDYHKEVAGSGDRSHSHQGDTQRPSRTDFSSTLSGSITDRPTTSEHRSGSDLGGQR